MATIHQSHSGYTYNDKKDHPNKITPTPHFNYETYYKHEEKQPKHTNALLQYLSDTELKHRNDNLYETELSRLPRRTDILNRYIKMNPNFEHLNRVYEPNLTNIEKQRYRRCVEQQQQKLHRTIKKFDFQTSDGHNSHYFLTGARYNRFDTVDSKILHKYGTFINRNNPDQVEIKASHFKKFREILQAQRRSSTGEVVRKDTSHDSSNERKHEDLDALANRYERNSNQQTNTNPAMYGRRHKLPEIKDSARYVDVGSQMPERRRNRRSVDRAMSSSSTHRSNRHRRQSQHQQQQSPAQQSSVSYVANKISFSLVNEPNPINTTTNKQNQDEYEIIITQDSDRHHHHHHHQQQHHNNSHETKDHVHEDKDSEQNNEDDNPIVVEKLQQRANNLVSDILASAMDHISMMSATN
ncbi:unnamed protein product [Adineta steineri]|uniref:Uncharacterized protein n=1 Tax=Adineta steineri TaxID=433720 RepID=A0A815NY52_9BILA|nr:unnamed protein product [Adineta steineri]